MSARETVQTVPASSPIKLEPVTEPEPLFNTCSQHLREIQNLQINQPRLPLNLVRRMSSNIVASTSTLASTSHPLTTQNLGTERIERENVHENSSADDSSEDDSNDDCIITDVTWDVTGRLRPYRSTTDNLIKYENDRISADMPYMKTVSLTYENALFIIKLKIFNIERRARLHGWRPSNGNCK